MTILARPCYLFQPQSPKTITFFPVFILLYVFLNHWAESRHSRSMWTSASVSLQGALGLALTKTVLETLYQKRKGTKCLESRSKFSLFFLMTWMLSYQSHFCLQTTEILLHKCNKINKQNLLQGYHSILQQPGGGCRVGPLEEWNSALQRY